MNFGYARISTDRGQDTDAQIDAAGAGLRSLTESIDTTTLAGRMIMQMVGVFAEFEREFIRDLVRFGKCTEADAARLFNVHRSTISRVKREASSDAAA